MRLAGYAKAMTCRVATRFVRFALITILTVVPAHGQDTTLPSPKANVDVFAIPQRGVSFLTGDTWIQNGQQLRLYGVQSCLRGTSFTNAAGAKLDCGEASLGMLAALIRDTKPTCSAIAQIPATSVASMPTILVVCNAHVGTKTLDLGTVLITEGFGFASFTNEAKPVYMPYLVAELTAKHQHSGLWASFDMPHPNSILFSAVAASRAKK